MPFMKQLNAELLLKIQICDPKDRNPSGLSTEQMFATVLSSELDGFL